MNFEIDKIRTSDKDLFNDVYKPTSVSKIMRDTAILTPTRAFQATNISLVRLKNELNEQVVVDYLKMWLLNLNKFIFSEPSKMQSKFQIDEIAQIIVTDYYYFNILEIALCFSKIKAGKLGKIYGQISGQYILDCFQMYREIRQKALREIDNDLLQDRLRNSFEAAEIVRERLVQNTLQDRGDLLYVVMKAKSVDQPKELKGNMLIVPIFDNIEDAKKSSKDGKYKIIAIEFKK